jgi:hypothetical protein
MTNITAHSRPPSQRFLSARSFSLFCGVLAIVGYAPAYAQMQVPVPAQTTAPADGLESAAPQIKASELYTVSNVPVDETAENAVIARKKALDTVFVTAFRMLAEKLAGTEKAATIQAPPPEIIATLVDDYEVAQERASGTRYVGRYIVRFDPKATSRYFNGQGVDLSEAPLPAQGASENASAPSGQATSAPLTLILPFWQKGGNLILWKDSNPFLVAFQKSVGTDPTSSLIPPSGDLDDISDIGDAEALTYDLNKLSGMAKRYGAQRVIVAVAEDNGGLAVNLYHADGQKPEFFRTVTIKAGTAGINDVLFDTAVAEVKKALISGGAGITPADEKPPSYPVSTKTQPASPPTSLSPAGQSQTIRADVNFVSMTDWLSTRNALGRVQEVSGLRIVSLSPRSATLEFSYQGDRAALAEAMKREGLALEGNPPVIKRRSPGSVQISP